MAFLSLVVLAAAANSCSSDQAVVTNDCETDPFTGINNKLAPGKAAAVRALVQDTLHAFSRDNATGAWYARTGKTPVMFVYTENGTAEYSSPAGTFGLSLTGIGREGAVVPATKGIAAAAGRELEIARPGFTEWYRNDDDGVEQGVTIMARPAGTSPLLVRFRVSGTGTLFPESGQELMASGPDGSPLFRYTGLHAFSADGRTLPAYFTTDGTTLMWIVDDTHAMYPVIIDPVVIPASGATASFTGQGADDKFGLAVALSEDGSRLVAGAPFYYPESGIGTGPDVVYLFEEPTDGWGSAAPETTTFTGTAGDGFGNAVAISADGSRVIVGAPYNDIAASDAGAAYLFEEPTDGWGSAAPATTTFTGTAAGDNFGWSVAISSDDGSRVVAGAPLNDTVASDAGAAYLFEEPAGGWGSAIPETSAFTGAATADRFGYSVAVSRDGAKVVAGAPYNDAAASNAGAVYLYKEWVIGWPDTIPVNDVNARFTGGAKDDNFGYSVAVSNDVWRLVIGAPSNETAASRAGTAYVFEEPGGGWSGGLSSPSPASMATVTFTGGEGERFGASVAISGRGSRVIVGRQYQNYEGPAPGYASLFEEPYFPSWSGTIPSADATTVFNGEGGRDFLGWSVAISRDGTRAAAGAPFNDTVADNAGAAFLFDGPFIILTAGGTREGVTDTTANGLTLNPTLPLKDIDLYLGPDDWKNPMYLVSDNIVSLPASTDTLVNGLDLTGIPPGPYYLIAIDQSWDIKAATNFTAYTVKPKPVLTPIASFAGTPLTGTSPLSVQFNDTSTNTPTMWNWSFGDNTWFNTTNPDLRNASNIYAAAGTFTVNLTVSNTAGEDTSSAPGYITVTAPIVAPVASFTGSPLTGTSPLSVQFNDTSTNTPTMWNWSFGDNSWFNTTNTDLRNVSHSYAAAGSFMVNLTVSNTAGRDTSSVPGYVTVTTAGTTMTTSTTTTTAAPGGSGSGGTGSGSSYSGRTYTRTGHGPGIAQYAPLEEESEKDDTSATLTPQTTTLPVPTLVSPSVFPFPIMLVLLIILFIVIIVLIWIVYRWWRYRQNPALFKEDD